MFLPAFLSGGSGMVLNLGPYQARERAHARALKYRVLRFRPARERLPADRTQPQLLASSPRHFHPE